MLRDDDTQQWPHLRVIVSTYQVSDEPLVDRLNSTSADADGTRARQTVATAAVSPRSRVDMALGLCSMLYTSTLPVFTHCYAQCTSVEAQRSNPHNRRSSAFDALLVGGLEPRDCDTPSSRRVDWYQQDLRLRRIAWSTANVPSDQRVRKAWVRQHRYLCKSQTPCTHVLQQKGDCILTVSSGREDTLGTGPG